ncbi:MAG TPA: putative metal-dependent hydrolase [Terriglobales bacterium]
MSTAPVLNLSYPIGKFQWTGPNTDAQRAEFIAEIAAVPDKLRSAVAGLTDAQLDIPYRPGGWTVRQLVHHIADSHMNAYVRFKLALTETEPLVKPYDEKAWAELPDSRLPIDISLQLIDSLHERWSVVLGAMKPADFSRTLKHPELGLVDLDRYVALYSWHGKHHVAHITELRNRETF